MNVLALKYRHQLQCCCAPCFAQVIGTGILKCLPPQTKNVHTTWSSWSVAVHVLTAAPPLRPPRHVTAIAKMAAAVLPVPKYILHHSICYTQANAISFTHNVIHTQDNCLSSPTQERYLMTSVTLAVLQWISVPVCTTAKSTCQESPTLTTVDPGKMAAWLY